jgi:hypothetical protein
MSVPKLQLSEVYNSQFPKPIRHAPFSEIVLFCSKLSELKTIQLDIGRYELSPVFLPPHQIILYKSTHTRSQ